MKGMEALWVLLFWAMLLFGAWLFEPRQTHHAPGRAAQVATWALLSILSLAYGSVLLFVIIHLLLFTLGTGAAAIGLLASLFLLVGTPVVWWLAVRAVVHRLDSRGQTPLKR
jgi:hypothetical protein